MYRCGTYGVAVRVSCLLQRKHRDSDHAGDPTQVGIEGEQHRLVPLGDGGDHAVDEAAA